MKTFNEWVTSKKESQQSLWERHKELPSIFRRTYYSLPTREQVEEFQQYPYLSSDDILDGFNYTIVGRGIQCPSNSKKIIDSIGMLVDRYPDNAVYQEALVKARG